MGRKVLVRAVVSLVVLASAAAFAPNASAAEDRTKLVCELLGASFGDFASGLPLNVQNAANVADSRGSGKPVAAALVEAVLALQRVPSSSPAAAKAGRESRRLCKDAGFAVPAFPAAATWPTKMSAQVAAVTKSIAAAHHMTHDEFVAWVRETTPADGGDNTFLFTPFLNQPFDFPYVQSESDGPGGTATVIVGPQFDSSQVPGLGGAPPNSLVYHSDLSLVGLGDDDPRTRVFPMTEHMSLVFVERDGTLRTSLVFYNGFVEVKLRDTKSGEATISFGTQIWPDGKKVTVAWISNLQDPNDARLGESQSSFSTQPTVIEQLNRHGVAPYAESQRILRTDPADYRSRLVQSVNKPVVMSYRGSEELSGWARFGTDGTFITWGEVDARIPGIDTNAFFPLQEAVVAAYFQQDPGAFDAAVAAAEARGIALTPKDSRRDIHAWIGSISGKVRDLESAFAALPLGIEAFLPGSSTPRALG